MLIVAEKFQTGFDQPLLHTMYVEASALANTEQNFGFTFDRRFEGLVIDRHHANGEMLRRFLDQPDFANLFTAWARGETFLQIREQAEGA